MARNGSGVYSLPAGSTVTNGDTSDATDVNTPLADLEQDANEARPVVAGGTGATSAAAALVNLGLTATAAEINQLDGLTPSGADTAFITGTAGTDGSPASWNADGDIIEAPSLFLAERADHLQTPVAGSGEFWIRSDSPNVPVFTDDTDVDRVLGYAQGNRVLATTSTATGGSSISWLDLQLTRFIRWEGDADNLAVTVDNTSPFLQFSPDFGTTWRDTASTDYEGHTVSAGTVAGRTATADFAVPLAFNGVGNAANEQGISGKIIIFGAESATNRTRFEISTVYRKANGLIEQWHCAGECLTAEAHNAVRVRHGSGLASGKIRWHGIVA